MTQHLPIDISGVIRGDESEEEEEDEEEELPQPKKRTTPKKRQVLLALLPPSFSHGKIVNLGEDLVHLFHVQVHMFTFLVLCSQRYPPRASWRR